MFELPAIVSLFAGNFVTFNLGCKLYHTNFFWERKERRQESDGGQGICVTEEGQWDWLRVVGSMPTVMCFYGQILM